MSNQQPNQEQLTLFLYDALCPQSGSPARGSWWAHSQQQAEFWLRSQGYTEIHLRPSPKTVIQVRVGDDALALFYRQLAVMFHAGIPLPDALRMASHSNDRHLAGVCRLLEDRICMGYSLSRAMKIFPSVFDTVTVGLLAAAEKSGRLPQTLSRLADTQERRYKLRKSLISAMTYPAILSLATLALAVLFLIYIFPINRELFSTLNLELPLFNRILSVCADVLTSPIFPVLLLALGGWIGVMARSTEFQAKLRDLGLTVAMKIPPVRHLIRKARALRMLEILGLLLGGGGTVDLALRFMIEASGDARSRSVFIEIRNRVIHGEDFGQALKASDFFPPLISSLLEVGYETGRVEEMARRAAEICEEDVRLAAETASALLEPILLAVAGLIAGIAVISSALPMLSLLQGL